MIRKRTSSFKDIGVDTNDCKTDTNKSNRNHLNDETGWNWERNQHKLTGDLGEIMKNDEKNEKKTERNLI